MHAEIQIHTSQTPRFGFTAGLREREDVLFSDYTGDENRGVRKRAEKALDQLQRPLQTLLAKDEVVLYVARAQAPVSMFEQFTMGWWLYYMTATTLVLTNKRLFHFSVNSKGKWKRSVRVVSWGDLVAAKASPGVLSGTLKLTYRNGKTEKYTRIRRGDGKAIRAILSAVLPASSGEVSAAGAMTSLCPECSSHLTAQMYRCGHCGLVFRDEKTLLRRALLIPGGGYFYIRQAGIACLQVVVELFLLLEIALCLVIGVDNITSPKGTGTAAENVVATLLAMGFFAAIMLVEKLIAFSHCRRYVREFIPASEGSAPIAIIAAGVGKIG